MDATQLREVQKKELQILLEVDRICKKYSLAYYLIGGSALGALRHGGFIPWDDDVDIAMPREDYRQFLKVCSTELPDAYFLQTYSTQPNFPYPFAFVTLNNTTFIKTRLRRLNIHHGISVDLFPLDGLPRHELFQVAEVRLVEYLNSLIIVRRLPLGLSPWITRWRCFVIEWIISRFGIKQSRKWANVIGGLREIMDREVYGTPRLMDFEGYQLPVPNQCERYLTIMYGDYMKIPPVAERRGHDPLIVDVSKSYVEYWRESL